MKSPRLPSPTARRRVLAFALALLALAALPAGAVADSWSDTTRPLHAVAQASATLLGNGQVLVAGGVIGSGTIFPTDEAERYDPASGQWLEAPVLDTYRSGVGASLLRDGRVLLTGGYDGSPVETVVFASALAFDPATNRWSAAAPMPNAHGGHAQVTLPDGRVLVLGGFASYDDLINDRADDHVDVYDPALGTWSTKAAIPSFTQGGTATLLNDGSVLLAGGASSNTMHDTAYRYVPATDRWSAAGRFAGARRRQAAALLPGGGVLIAGGEADGGGALASASRYDPGANRWTAVAPMATPRIDATATTLPNGKVLVAGGTPDGRTYLASAELFDPATNTWSPAPSMRTGRTRHTATLLADGRVLVAGGIGDDQGLPGTLPSAEIYTPDGWPFPRGGGGGGGSGGGPGSGGSGGVPAISKLALSATRFRAADSGPSATSARRRAVPVGTTIIWRDAAAATATFVVQRPASGRKSGHTCVKPTHANRRKPRCTRWIAVGRFTHADAAGVDRLHFSGRIGGRKLHPGTYRFSVTARIGRGRPSAARTIGFTIVR